MEEIIDSIINGQRKQALQQLIDSQYTLEDLFERLLDSDMDKELLTMYRVAVNTGYITFKD